LKSVFNQSIAYSRQELEAIAKHCTKKEEDVEKVERKMRKSATTLVLASQLNQVFDALVTGVNVHGTWVRIFHPPIEGKLIEGGENLDVGDKTQVKLVHIDVAQGFIDFIRV
jgi:exoribonuclease-2